MKVALNLQVGRYLRVGISWSMRSDWSTGYPVWFNFNLLWQGFSKNRKRGKAQKICPDKQANQDFASVCYNFYKYLHRTHCTIVFSRTESSYVESNFNLWLAADQHHSTV